VDHKETSPNNLLHQFTTSRPSH